MIKICKFKVFVVPVALCTLLVFNLTLCSGEEYSQNQDYHQQQQQQPQQQSYNNGYSNPSSPPLTQSHQSYHHRNHPSKGGSGYPTESRTGIVPLFFPMIVFVGVVLLVFFAVVGSAAVIGGATSAIGRHDGPPHLHRFAFAREFSSSAALARDVLSSEECVERVSCEVFRIAKGYKAQNWILRMLDILPSQSNLTKRASRAIWKQNKTNRSQRSGKSRTSRERWSGRENCQEYKCSKVSSFVNALKKLK